MLTWENRREGAPCAWFSTVNIKTLISEQYCGETNLTNSIQLNLLHLNKMVGSPVTQVPQKLWDKDKDDLGLVKGLSGWNWKIATANPSVEESTSLKEIMRRSVVYRRILLCYSLLSATLWQEYCEWCFIIASGNALSKVSILCICGEFLFVWMWMYIFMQLCIPDCVCRTTDLFCVWESRHSHSLCFAVNLRLCSLPFPVHVHGK